MQYQHRTYEDCLLRYPRLCKLMSRVALLTTTEAGCALRDYRSANHAFITNTSPFSEPPFDIPGSINANWKEWGEMMLRYGGGEAVAHFGGPARVLQAALEIR